MKDQYDKAIEYLKENPREIKYAWNKPTTHPAGCLFQKTTVGNECGCLTQVKNFHGGWRAPTDQIAFEIRLDDRIPKDVDDITLESLPAFAEWQRRLEREFGPLHQRPIQD